MMVFTLSLNRVHVVFTGFFNLNRETPPAVKGLRAHQSVLIEIAKLLDAM